MNNHSVLTTKHFVSTTKSEVVVSYGNPHKARFLWIVLHGYGQLAEEFIEHFMHLQEDEHYLVVPNALHHFYLKGGSGKIGSSWMTAYNRELDIHDNNQYLQRVLDTFVIPHYTKDKKVIIFGFSQGAPTMIRFVASQKCSQITDIVLWGAVFPPDVDIQKNMHNLKDKNWYYVIGDNDEYISEQEKRQQIELLHNNGLNPTIIDYQGKHAIQKDALERLIKCLDEN